ncbi:MAG: response regulator [Desulfuromusa sp.]|jgi:signal transduction histidine kinase/CheY-like chemotaxis protein|nr:response regulator [Desulfuromusa sp.]
MKLFHGSIRKKLLILVLVATMPVFIVLLGTELQNSHRAAQLAEKDTAIYLSGFAEIERRITNSTHTLLRTVASIPDIYSLDEEKSRVILSTLLETNPIYTNVILVDLKGNVVAAGKNHDSARALNFSDRKQFKEAIASKGFASGEFVVGKSTKEAIFPFGMAVQNKQGEVTGAIIIGVSLVHYGEFFERGDYPENSFFGICDHNGIRLFRYPVSDQTGIGEPINQNVYEAAKVSEIKGSLSAQNSDGKKRIMAFEALRIEGNKRPYIYMFMGVASEQIQAQSHSIINRLMTTSVLSLSLSLFIAWFLGGRGVVQLIDRLSHITKKFSQGDKSVKSNIDYSDGEIGGLAESFDNMVDMIHQREEEKTRLLEQLNQAHKMDAIGQLAGGIAHDFNNMLGGILGAGQMLPRYLSDEPKAQKLHSIIMQSATRAADLTGKLLTFSRTSSKASTPVNMHALIQETITLLQNTTDRRIKIETELKANQSSIVGDPSQLQSTMLNLGINASQAMPNGGTLRFATRLLDIDDITCNSSPFDLHPGQFLEIEVTDTGCGISAENIHRIFEPFFTTKEQGKGTGLGLAAVYGTITQHGGSITVYSEVNNGTNFKILLPLNTSAVAQKPVCQEIIKGQGNILVVDDEEVMRLTTKAILEDLGYSVLLAENGEEALSVYKASKKPVDLVILDMIMPVMNGKDCFFALKKLHPEARIILSSGFVREEDLEDMKRSGLKGYINKPYLSDALSQSVYNALSNG